MNGQYNPIQDKMPSKEDVTQSGATKVKNEQDSDDKKNLKKTGFQ